MDARLTFKQTIGNKALNHIFISVDGAFCLTPDSQMPGRDFDNSKNALTRRSQIP
jgi:hypothetical protein